MYCCSSRPIDISGTLEELQLREDRLANQLHRAESKDARKVELITALFCLIFLTGWGLILSQSFQMTDLTRIGIAAIVIGYIGAIAARMFVCSARVVEREWRAVQQEIARKHELPQ